MEILRTKSQVPIYTIITSHSQRGITCSPVQIRRHPRIYGWIRIGCFKVAPPVTSFMEKSEDSFKAQMFCCRAPPSSARGRVHAVHRQWSLPIAITGPARWFPRLSTCRCSTVAVRRQTAVTHGLWRCPWRWRDHLLLLLLLLLLHSIGTTPAASETVSHHVSRLSCYRLACCPACPTLKLLQGKRKRLRAGPTAGSQVGADSLSTIVSNSVCCLWRQLCGFFRIFFFKKKKVKPHQDFEFRVFQAAGKAPHPEAR